MSLISKFAFWFVATAIFIFLLFFTFLVPEKKNLINLTIDKVETGFFRILFDWNKKESENKISVFSNDTKDSIYLDRVNTVDSIYFSKSNYKKNIDNDNINIYIWEWEFLFDIRWKDSFYNISNSSFNLEILGPGKVYINTIDPEDFKIFSMDSLSKISLWDPKNQEEINAIYLFPHVYFWFDPELAKYYSGEDVDFFRIKSVFKPEYFWDSIYLSNEINKNLFSKLPKLNTEFVNRVFTLGNIEYTTNSAKLRSLKNAEFLTDINSLEFPWIDYIRSYFAFFLNDTKKRIYYKQLIVKKLIILITSNTENDEDAINVLNNYFNEIKVYDEEYTQMIDMLNMYYKLTSTNTNKDFIYSKENLYDLIYKINNKNKIVRFSTFNDLNYIYSYFDFEGDFMYNKLMLITTELFQKINEDEKNISILWNVIFQDYFSFFLEQIFLSVFNSDDLFEDNNLNDILKVVDKYISLSKGNYSKWLNAKNIVERKRTAIRIYLDILEKLDVFIRFWFFEKVRTDKLLTIKDDNLLDKEKLDLLEKDINSLISFYNDNKDNLDDSDEAIIKRYKSIIAKSKEYFFALRDYKKYLISGKKIGIKAVSNAIEDEWLNNDSFKKYISYYNWIRTEDLEIEIKDDYYYKVGWLFVDGQIFSFDLYPFDNYKIDNIFINYEELNTSYKLWVDDRDKDFFIGTFLTKQENDVVIFTGSVRSTEDKVIYIFKRDTLLGAKWDLYFLNNLLKIDYGDIKVEKVLNSYEVFINHSLVIYKDYKREISFSSQYVLADKDRYFDKIKITIEKDTNPININLVWVIPLLDLEKEVTPVLWQLAKIKYIHDNIIETLWVKNINIKYYLFKWKTNIKFDYKNKNVSITLFGNNIESIFVWDEAQSIVKRQTNYKNIQKYLNLIN